jgi:hypothetical protein
MKVVALPANHKALDLVTSLLQRLLFLLQTWKFAYAEEGYFTINKELIKFPCCGISGRNIS